MTTQKFESYSTEKEKEFIDGLGTFSDSNKTKMAGRAELLRRYIVANRARNDWYGMDRQAVQDYAMEAWEQASISA